MEQTVSVKNLKKYYRVFEKEPGISGAIKQVWARKYKDVKAVDGISFSIGAGELVGFIGPNGAGKTTTLKVLSGLLYPTAGAVKVEGFTPWERKSDFLKQISLVMGQKNQLWWELPAIETFLLNKAIYEIPDKKFEKNLSELSRLLEVEGLLRIPVRRLSLGQRMKMELIAALIHSPKILFLDEPTIGLDVVMQKTLRDFIKTYNEKYKATIILTSHYMGDVRELAKRVIIIDRGKIIYDGLLEDVVRRFAKEKIINIVFSKEPDPKKLASIGDVIDYNFPRATLSIPNESTPVTAAEILRKFSVADITIEDTPIEEIIREVFSGGKVK
ncbi:MAG: ATP-binding cassette domain-containing protein [Candidatus Blackburnbacteria bacterium]|nr:ATP-binding cassette domain-containing protein [Candidatus Blackburnbacteria bacterium]